MGGFTCVSHLDPFMCTASFVTFPEKNPAAEGLKFGLISQFYLFDGYGSVPVCVK
jgi:hypothetical protein